jgi:hypothetical protein
MPWLMLSLVVWLGLSRGMFLAISWERASFRLVVCLLADGKAVFGSVIRMGPL